MSNIVYKLTTQDMTTYNGFPWVVGAKVTTKGTGDLCSAGWLHFYLDPLLAVLLNPIHGGYHNPRLFEAEIGGRIKHDRGLKGGASEMRLVREIPLPVFTPSQRAEFAGHCAAFAHEAAKGPRLSPEEIANELVNCAAAVL